MKQGVMPFQYEEEKSSTGMTALSGLMTYLELMQALGHLPAGARRRGECDDEVGHGRVPTGPTEVLRGG